MAPPGSHQTRLGEQECAMRQAYKVICISQSMNQKVNLIVKEDYLIDIFKNVSYITQNKP